MAEPATRWDRPGDWHEAAVLAEFKAERVDELLSLGLIQRGGHPTSPPDPIAEAFSENVIRADASARKLALRGEPPYPAGPDVLLITARGWSWLVARAGDGE